MELLMKLEDRTADQTDVFIWGEDGKEIEEKPNY
jgi:hypothetical protein